MRRIKKDFDPEAGIMNPGKVLLSLLGDPFRDF
jgi:FAD/FMN-containing dehydrogenase